MSHFLPLDFLFFSNIFLQIKIKMSPREPSLALLVLYPLALKIVSPRAIFLFEALVLFLNEPEGI